MEKQASVTSSLFRYFIIVFVVSGSIIFTALTFFYNIRTQEYLDLTSMQEDFSVTLQKRIIIDSLNEVISDLKFLSNQNELLTFLDSQNTDLIPLISNEYAQLSNAKQYYDQIRYIDETGLERIRVNLAPNGSIIVSDTELQYKGDRYYFKDSIELGKNEFFISPFDLNIENGEIEIPHKPMIRFSTPVFDRDGNRRGIVILNFLGNIILDRIKEMKAASLGSSVLLNSDGYCLLSPFVEDNWAFMFEEKRENSFYNRFPMMQETLTQSAIDQVSNSDGMFTFLKIYPIRESFKSSDGAPTAKGSSEILVEPNEYYWYVLSFVSPEKIESVSNRLLVRIILLSLVLFILSACMSAVIAYFLSKRRYYHLTILENARFDRLTKLYNRNYFVERLKEAIIYADRYNKKLALCFIDLDGFKPINDEFGHDAGDYVLTVISRRLKESIRQTDLVGRFGGDEFLICFTEVSDDILIESKIKKIISIVSEKIEWNQQEISCGCSIGVCYYPIHANDYEELINFADEAMYAAKSAGKNTFRVCDPNLRSTGED